MVIRGDKIILSEGYDDDEKLFLHGSPGRENDPVEETAEYKTIEKELHDAIIAEIGDRTFLGYCHLYWMTKKRILKEKYGIEWKSPAERNPHVCYD